MLLFQISKCHLVASILEHGVSSAFGLELWTRQDNGSDNGPKLRASTPLEAARLSTSIPPFFLSSGYNEAQPTFAAPGVIHSSMDLQLVSRDDYA